jgi:hypothetical protein
MLFFKASGDEKGPIRSVWMREKNVGGLAADRTGPIVRHLKT